MRRATRFLLPVLALLLAAGCGRGCGRGRPQPAAAESHRAVIAERHVDLGSDARLAVRCNDGSIRVHAADVAQVRVTGEIAARSPWPHEAKAIARAPVVRVGTDAAGRVLVEGRAPRGRAIGASVHLDVTVPRGIDLLVEALGAGDVEVEGVTGPLEVRAASGAVRLRGVSGPITATTRRAGAVEVSGAVAEVHVDAAGAATVESSAPRLARDSAVSSRRGDATVRVPAGFAAIIDLSAPRGVASDDFSLPRGDGGVSGASLGSGGPRLAITAIWGNAALRRR